LNKLNRSKTYRVNVRRILAFLLALYIFNFSIDSPDAQPDCIPEDLSNNDTESVYELLLEDVLGIESAIDEHDERDEDDRRAFGFQKYVYNGTLTGSQFRINTLLSKSSLRDYREDFASRPHEVHSPPPKG